MKKLAILILILFNALVFSQPNYSGYKDTVAVADFQGTGTGTTRAFVLNYKKLRVSALADDTAETGYASDSIQFQWGIQTGNVLLNSSGKRDTTWQEKLVVDTFDILTAANLVAPTYLIDTVGLENMYDLFIDTIGITGFAAQDVLIKHPLSPIFRFWYLGLDGNRTADGYVVLIFSATGLEEEL
jgi:hypothetical protein